MSKQGKKGCMSELEIYHCDEWHNQYREFDIKEGDSK